MDDPQHEMRLPTLAILPFARAGATEEDALLAQGLHGDICGELTRFRGLRVISPASSTAVADLTDDRIGARLRASHVLRGHLRRNGNQLRLDTALSCTRDATQIWSERLHVPEGEIQALEIEVVGRIAATLNARLEEDLLLVARRSAADLAPHLSTLRGFRLLRDGTIESDEAALALFHGAIVIDPALARAHAGVAFSWFNEWSCQYWNRYEENGRLAYYHAHAALALDDRDALLHQVLGKVHLIRRDYERASWYFDRALALCPNDADLLIAQCVYSACLGDHVASIAHATRAMLLHPFHPNAYFGLAAIAHLLARDAATASDFFSRSDGLPYVGIPAFHAIALGHLDRIDEARAAFADFLERYRDKIVYGAAPEASEAMRWFFDFYPFRSEADAAFLLEGFGRACADAPAPCRQPPAMSAGVLSRNSAGWHVEFAGETAHLPALKGIADIHLLLENAGKEIHCLDLSGRHGEDLGGEILDEKARSAVKRRIRDLQEALAEAEDMNNIGRAEAARAEMDQLVQALASALGLGGRARRLGDAAEKARTSVTWRIRHALRRIEAAHPALGRHLSNSIRTGTFCSYRPETGMAWRLSGAARPLVHSEA
jgi:TolB-like protein